MAADRMDLRKQRDIGARVVRLDGRAHARAAGADDEDIVLGLHHRGSYTMLSLWAAASAGRGGCPRQPPRDKFRTLLGPGLCLPPISGGCAVVAGALVVEREAGHAQRSGGIARRVELPGDAVARRDVADRRAAVGAEWPAIRERERE